MCIRDRRPSDRGVQVAETVHRDASRVSSFRSLADSLEFQPGPCPEDEPVGDKDEHDAGVDHEVLIEEDRPDERDRGETGDGQVWNACKRLVDVWVAEE